MTACLLLPQEGSLAVEAIRVAVIRIKRKAVAPGSVEGRELCDNSGEQRV